MNFEITVNNINYCLDIQLLQKKISMLKLMYEKNSEQAFFSLVLLDDYNTRKYIVSKIKEYVFDLKCYDTDIIDFSLKEFTKNVKERFVIVLNLNSFFEQLSNEKNISVYEAKDLFYQSINMCRDSVFLKYDATFLMFLNDDDYYHFMDVADDFFSCCQCRLNINECFFDKDNQSLDEYYKENHLKKILRKST